MKIKFILLTLVLLVSFLGSTQTDSPEQRTTVVIHTPTPSLKNSLSFYKKLEYKVISEANPTLITDGKNLLEINADRKARAGLKMYRKSWTEEVEKLKPLTTVYEVENGYLLNDLNGCWIYLINDEFKLDYPLADSATAVTGNFMGLSLESANMARSLEIWTILGFSTIMGSAESGFIIIQNAEGFSLSMMKPLLCPHLFFNPSMTFFNGKNNLNIIKKIRKLGIPITEEITVFNKEGIVDNIIIRDPGGYGFFIFSD
ncbi:MAG: hypothetical protein R2780_13165 [Crocinitomicaceae bacterium]|nr:hypothetical protein [Crocinitomicaceae bacterium]